tara:strand:+ start:941 stop:1813 length:873 start_codon:yes stop_codon:yes gene_type:complete
MDFITSAEFKPKNMGFSKPIPQAAGTYRVMVQYLNESTEQKAPLYVLTPKLFSFGVSPQAAMGESLKDDHSNVTTYTLPLVLYNHNNGGPTKEEQDFIDLLETIVQKVKDHCVTEEFNSDIARYGDDSVTASDLKKLNPIYVKRERGVPVAGKSPMLYPKIKHKVVENKVSFSTIFNENNSSYTTDTSMRVLDVDPHSLIGSRMHVKAKLHIESIFIGSRISIQLKLSQVLYESVDQVVPIRIAPFGENVHSLTTETQNSQKHFDASENNTPNIQGSDEIQLSDDDECSN